MDFYPYCEYAALKQTLNCNTVIARSDLRTIKDNTHGWGVTVRQTAGPHYFLDARKHAGVARAYGILASPDLSGIYVPIGRQSVGTNQYISPVPICVGGGRDMELRSTGLLDESDREVIEREAEEELQQAITVNAVNALNTSAKIATNQARYSLVTLQDNLSSVYYSWDVDNSDQVVAVRWWPLPFPGDIGINNRGSLHNPVLALQLYDDLGCSPQHRATWGSEWHAVGYQAAIFAMLVGSVSARSMLYYSAYDLRYQIATRSYTYGTTYANFPAQNFVGHRCNNSNCTFPTNC